MTKHRCIKPTCRNEAHFYWHDAGPLGAGTFWACEYHAPAEAEDEFGDWRDDDFYRDEPWPLVIA